MDIITATLIIPAAAMVGAAAHYTLIPAIRLLNSGFIFVSGTVSRKQQPKQRAKGAHTSLHGFHWIKGHKFFLCFCLLGFYIGLKSSPVHIKAVKFIKPNQSFFISRQIIP